MTRLERIKAAVKEMNAFPVGAPQRFEDYTPPDLRVVDLDWLIEMVEEARYMLGRFAALESEEKELATWLAKLDGEEGVKRDGK